MSRAEAGAVACFSLLRQGGISHSCVLASSKLPQPSSGCRPKYPLAPFHALMICCVHLTSLGSHHTRRAVVREELARSSSSPRSSSSQSNDRQANFSEFVQMRQTSVNLCRQCLAWLGRATIDLEKECADLCERSAGLQKRVEQRLSTVRANILLLLQRYAAFSLCMMRRSLTWIFIYSLC